MFKVKNGVSTGLTEDIFQIVNETYILRKNGIPLRKEIVQCFMENKYFVLVPKICKLTRQSLKYET